MSLRNFSALRDLHNSANDLLHSPEIQQVLVHQKQEKLLHQASESSLRMLDVCSISKDVLLLVKEHLLDLQLTLRRASANGQPNNVSTKVAAYNQYRRKLKKETLKCLRSLKEMKDKSLTSDKIDHNLMVVVEVLREVRVITTSIVESLLYLISIPLLDQSSSNKGFFRSKIFLMGSSGQRLMYDFCDETALHSANKRLEAVEIAIEDVEVKLECMFRRLIHAWQK